MRTLFFDCSSGISGNMVLGALTELVGGGDVLLGELGKLGAGGYRVDFSRRAKNGITGTHVEVTVDGVDEYGHVHTLGEPHGHGAGHWHGEGHSHGHGLEADGHQHHGNGEDASHPHQHHGNGGGAPHSHHHAHRNLADVNVIIDGSGISDGAKELAKRIFLRVAKAESKVHGRPLEEVHFHEVGAIDSIVDIVGTAVLIDYLKPDRIVSSIVNDGFGFIECAHGTMSVPVPATSEILAAGKVIFRQIDVEAELVTPTGAAIIAELAEAFGPMPAMQVAKVGWGAGTKDLRIPNVLKVTMGDETAAYMTGGGAEEALRPSVGRGLEVVMPGEPQRDAVCVAGVQSGESWRLEADGAEGLPVEELLVMETNIDDCSPEILGYVMERLLAAGACDVFYTPVFMKKNRPAYLLTVTCHEGEVGALREILFRETTTIGVRCRREERAALERERVVVQTPYGSVEAKKVTHGDTIFVYPEYESMRRLAAERGVPLKELYRWNYKQS